MIFLSIIGMPIKELKPLTIRKVSFIFLRFYLSMEVLRFPFFPLSTPFIMLSDNVIQSPITNKRIKSKLLITVIKSSTLSHPKHLTPAYLPHICEALFYYSPLLSSPYAIIGHRKDVLLNVVN